MPRGYADFGLDPSNYGQFSGDNAELAARLKSPVVFERRGRVLWYDDLTNGLGKYQISLAGTAVANYVQDAGFLNGCAIQLKPDAAAVNRPLLLFTLPIISETKLGIEMLMRWVSNNDANCTGFRIIFYYHDGSIQHTFYYWFDPLTNRIGVNSSTPLPGGWFYPIVMPYSFWGTGTEVGTNYFKTVINLKDLSFDRIIYNQLGANLKIYTSVDTPMVDRPRLDVLLACIPNAAANALFLSNLIVTLDEP